MITKKTDNVFSLTKTAVYRLMITTSLRKACSSTIYKHDKHHIHLHYLYEGLQLNAKCNEHKIKQNKHDNNK